MPQVIAMNSDISEKWLPVSGYEELYLISNQGRVKNKKTSKLLKIRYTKSGYARVNLSKEGRLETFRVHRLVGTHFLPNPKDLPEINHINEDKTDNRAENLEWCDKSYNVNFGTRTQRQREKVSKPVIQLTMNGEEVGRYDSTVQAGKETGLNHHRIADCCRGDRKSTGGFRWAYREVVSA